MKTKLTMSAAVAALMGMSGVAIADTDLQFIPVENLMPDERQIVFNSLSQMMNGAELDWDRVAVGVDQNGQIVILQKDADQAASKKSAGSPSSFGKAAATGSPSTFGMAVKTDLTK